MLQVKELTKKYGKNEIVKGISFHVNKGETFGLLGPNGAGKSTTIGMVSGLLKADYGDVQVGGYDVRSKPNLAKQKIGIVPQDIALYPTMTAKENLLFWGKMYGLTSKKAKQRVVDVLENVGLTERANDKIDTFSGGMKRRINIGAALMHEPELLIMDEPTVGIDPQSRNHILETVKSLNRDGMTIIYTSHYMEEVEYLCERIGIMDHGHLIALGTKKDLCQRLMGNTIVEVELEKWDESFFRYVSSLEGIDKVTGLKHEKKLEFFSKEPQQLLSKLFLEAPNYKVTIVTVQMKEANLESLFLQLTGRTLRD